MGSVAFTSLPLVSHLFQFLLCNGSFLVFPCIAGLVCRLLSQFSGLFACCFCLLQVHICLDIAGHLTGVQQQMERDSFCIGVFPTLLFRICYTFLLIFKKNVFTCLQVQVSFIAFASCKHLLLLKDQFKPFDSYTPHFYSFYLNQQVFFLKYMMMTLPYSSHASGFYNLNLHHIIDQ